MSIADKLSTIAENMQKVYDSGKKEQNDEFWNQLQNEGVRTDYAYAFCNSGFVSIDPLHQINAAQANYMFMNCNKLETMSGISINLTSKNPNLQSMFMGCVKMQYAPDLNFTACSVCRTYTSIYANCASLKQVSVWLGDGTQNPISIRNNMQNAFLNCNSLTDITFTGAGSPYKLDLSACTKLNISSITSLLNAVMDVSAATSGDYTIKLSADTYALITDDTINGFETKGWTITGGN